MQVKNITSGPKGIWNKDGELVTLEPGETREIDLAEGEEAGEWFEFGGKPAKAAKGGRRAAEPVEPAVAEDPAEGEIDGA
jgi:hypothetical protein